MTIQLAIALLPTLIVLFVSFCIAYFLTARRLLPRRPLVRPGDMFVLGDYRDNSLDSRAWGVMPISQLHGRAQFIWLTVNSGSGLWNRVGIR
jgi:hypothetical protein